MTNGVHAWVTSAVAEKDLRKAIVLARSLRQVFTSKKLVVFTSPHFPKELRAKLKTVFDLVLILEDTFDPGQHEINAKIQSLSLSMFEKCVYLSPNTIVLKNCDDIFQNEPNKNDGGINSSVFLFKPALKYAELLEKIENGTNQELEEWKKNVKFLDNRYNFQIDLSGQIRESLEDVSIANFEKLHPLDMDKPSLEAKLSEAGPVEKLAVEKCLSLDFTASPKVDVDFMKWGKEPIAIVGLSFRLPGGNNIEEFWDLLSNGKDAIGQVPDHRWRKNQWFQQCSDRKIKGGFLPFPVDTFDAKFFGISPKEAEFLDPQQRLLLEVSWEALEDALIDPIGLRGSNTGVFCGSWLQDYKELGNSRADTPFFRNYMGTSIATQSSRLSHYLELTGPSVSTESGCSSGIVAVHMACKSLQRKETNLALACGVNLLLKPFNYDSINIVLSKTGRCNTFDAGADGFGRAEGAAVLVLKRLSDAVKDGDNIWGLIRGSAITQEGLSPSLGTPTVHCESLAMSLALQDAGVHPKDVSFIEAHGTGTPVGDPLEISAVSKVYATLERAQPLIIGSVKTNVGHTESVSGITGIIKVLLAMKNELIPPHLNLKRLNPAINLNAIPAIIPLDLTAWPKEEYPRIAGVSSFGISGTDGHAIIQEPPSLPRSNPYKMERPLHILKISAKCPESLEKLLKTYEKICENEKNASFADVAHSANTGRADFPHRVAIIAKDFPEAKEALKSKSFLQSEVTNKQSKICFLFPGQGTQYPTMASGLYGTSPVFKHYFDKCAKRLLDKHGINIRSVLWGENTELNKTLYSQTTIFVVEYCLLKLWESWGVQPDYVVGHSLGEFAAACAAKILDFEDALMLVAERSKLIEQLPCGKMLVIRADKEKVEDLIKTFQNNNSGFWVDYAAVNTSNQTVIAGDSENIETFSKYCEEKSIKCSILSSSHAFHSRHMDPILEAYQNIAKTVKPTKARDLPKFISGMEGKIVNPEDINESYWVRHAREPVNFLKAMKTCEQEGCTIFLEVGPHPVLSAFIGMTISPKSGKPVVCLPSLRRGREEMPTMLESLAKLYLSEWKGKVDWKGFDFAYNRTRVPVPFYQFNRKPVWLSTRFQHGNIHPLLGKYVPNASEKTIFEAELTPTNYLQDHVIGNTVVFPGAAFLEMCLAGGVATLQGQTEEMKPPSGTVTLQGLKIKAPLALFNEKVAVLQTIVKLQDVGYYVEVYAQNGRNWTLHASAKFLPVASNLPEPINEKINIQLMKSSCNSLKTDLNNFYSKLPEVGLRFGEKFRSLENAWGDNKWALVQVKMPEPEGYLIHPVAADAMIQSVMFWQKGIKKKLQVPVQIGEFIYLEQNKTKESFIYCSENNGKKFAILLDGNGEALAYMESIEFAETTDKMVQMMAKGQSKLPGMWQEIYKPLPGKIYFDRVERQNNPSWEIIPCDNPEENNFYEYITGLTKRYVLNGFYQLGWEPEVNQSFKAVELFKSLNISEAFIPYCEFFLKEIVQLGYLENVGGEYVFQDLAPNPQEILDYVRKGKETGWIVERAEFGVIQEIGENITGILTGQKSPLSLLFSSNGGKTIAEEFYFRMYQHFKGNFSQVMNEEILPVIKSAVEKAKTEGIFTPTVRILEIGAGTGFLTREYVGALEAQNLSNFEYWYTDISATFVKHAETIFKTRPNHLIFKKFNMEDDPIEQEIPPSYFNIILAADVLHVAKNLKETLQRIRTLLKPNGMFQIIETVLPSPVITFIFGLLEGYWNFEDFDLRPDHATLTVSKWKATLESTGFCSVSSADLYQNAHAFIHCFAGEIPHQLIPCPRSNFWILFESEVELSRLIQKHLESALNRNVVVVSKPKTLTENETKDIISSAVSFSGQLEGVIYLWGLTDEIDQKKLGLPFLTLCQQLLKTDLSKIIIITQGHFNINGSQVQNPFPATITGMAKCISNETNLKTFHLDLDPLESPASQVNSILENIWVNNEPAIAFRAGNRYTPKLAPAKIEDKCLRIPKGCDRFQLILPQSKSISDLEYGYLLPFELGEKEVEVKVKAMSLNFRDVLTVLKPTADFNGLNSVGLDFAGVVVRVGAKVCKWKVGDKVFGMNSSKNLSMPSHLKTNEAFLARLPSPKINFSEGATLPAVFFTVYHCLVNLAKMKRGETLLLHTASGGVGLCAIQLAQHFGVEIIATAGNERKRNYLRNLGIKNVFNSRTTQFGNEILEVTGKGVDIVLNSLTGEGFKEATLKALAPNGRFIEMSKMNIWTEEEVKSQRPDVFYKIVDLTEIETDEFKGLINALEEHVEKQLIKPIPYKTFDALNIKGALKYLQKAKHIGKVVCLMPEVKIGSPVKTSLFNEESTYVVTGGLGGIGFEVVKYMLSNGAHHIAVLARSELKPEVKKIITELNALGKHVEVFKVDVGKYEECKALFHHLQAENSGFPPIRGVMHAAGVLQNALVPNQSWESFDATFNPKIKGTWNLHELTKDLLLEHFVVFSSIASTLGSPGQANHTASNSFMDAFALWRESLGLTATSINWGNWGEVGVATEVDFPGLHPITNKQGLLALETILKTQSSHIVVLNVDSFSFLSHRFPNVKQYVADKRLFGETSRAVFTGDKFWENVEAANETDKLKVFKEFIKSTLKNILKLDTLETVDEYADFKTLGIDSLMMVELKNSLQNILGARIPITVSLLRDCKNTENLAKTLLNSLENKIPEREENGTDEEILMQLIQQDLQLPQNINTLELPRSANLSQIKNIFLTGATGTLGPYILKELCDKPEIEKIYCLLRKSTKEDLSTRLQTRLDEIGLTNHINLDKINCIEGDLALERFGLAVEDYNNLAEQVDAVIHCAVMANHNEKYGKQDEEMKESIREVNVKGTLRILEFAVAKTLKRVFYTSTLSSVLSATAFSKSNYSFEEWQDPEILNENLSGYAISKLISENLLKQAIGRGIPVKVFRLGMLGGESKTGRNDYLKTHILQRWLGQLKLRKGLKEPYPIQIFPVDLSAKLALEVFFNPEAPSDVYAICYPQIGTNKVLAGIATEMGIEIEKGPLSLFFGKSSKNSFKKKTEQDNELKEASQQNETVPDLKFLKFTKNFEEIETMQTCLKRDIQVLQNSGVLAHFGI